MPSRKGGIVGWVRVADLPRMGNRPAGAVHFGRRLLHAKNPAGRRRCVSGKEFLLFRKSLYVDCKFF